MRFAVADFYSAISLNLSADLASRVAATVRDFGWQSETITPEEAARLLIRAVLEREPDSLPLLTAMASVGEDAFTLEPDDVAAHPLFGIWTRGTAADQIALILTTGAVRSHVAPGAPYFDEFELTVTPTGVHGGLCLRFPGISTTLALWFGGQPQGGFRTTHRLSGDALVSVGRHARSGEASLITDNEQPTVH